MGSAFLLGSSYFLCQSDMPAPPVLMSVLLLPMIAGGGNSDPFVGRDVQLGNLSVKVGNEIARGELLQNLPACW